MNTHPPRERDPLALQSTGRRGRLWIDPRLVIGVVLILASVVGVTGLVAATDSRVVVLASRDTLVAGDHVTAADLVETKVRVSGAERLYLQASRLPSRGVVVTRTIAAGELVPASAVSSISGRTLTSLVVTSQAALAESIGPGSRVDVWAARRVDTDQYGSPRVLVTATVVRVVEQKNTIVGSGTGTAVELLVPRLGVAGLLEDTANGALITVLPSDLPLGDRG